MVYLFDGEGRLSYTVPRDRARPGVSWVASTGRSFLATRPEELSASVPRLTQTGPLSCALLLPLADRGEVHAVVMLVRRSSEVLAPRRRRARQRARRAGRRRRSRSCGPGPRRGPTPSPGSMNHRAMRRRLREEIDRASRSGGQLSCLLIDLDDFKAVNDLLRARRRRRAAARRRARARGRVPGLRPRRPLRRGRVRRDPPQRRAGRGGGGGHARARAPARDPRRGRHGPGGLGLDRRRRSGARRWTSTSCWRPPTPPCCAPSARARAASRARPTRFARRTLRDSVSATHRTGGQPMPGEPMSQNSFGARDELACGGQDVRDLPPAGAAARLRRRAPAVLAEGAAREPAAHRGQRLGGRGGHRGARPLGREGRAEQGDLVHPRARADAGPHRGARGRRPRRDARRDGRRWGATRR